MTDIILDNNKFIESIDNYALYSHILGFKPVINKSYKSPIRNDDNIPSFELYRSQYNENIILWKDFAVNIKPMLDVVDLVAVLYNCSKVEARLRIQNLDYPKLMEVSEIPENHTSIRVITRGFKETDYKFWNSFNINEEILNLYRVKAILCYWLYESQEYPKFTKQSYCYCIDNKVQIYSPFERREYKFRNNLTDKNIMGFTQLNLSERNLLIITKSYKDVMVLHSLGYESISPRGENILLPKQVIQWVSKYYDTVIVLFDNDGKESSSKYPFRRIYVPKESGEKDISDFIKKYGVEETKLLLNKLIEL